MSKTLFWYILKDLLRIFIMASVVLAGIMSFGGLLKPLMRYGLTASQIGKMLLCFLPATQTYSLSIAALFATTVVYGRLAADNEITACRASGISYLSLTLPAVVLGLTLSIVSLVCLSFVVPHYMLKVEKVAFDSLADIVQKSIQRSHQLKLSHKDKDRDFVIYAESAEVLPPSKDAPDDEMVVLYGPMFCNYTFDPKLGANIPSEFFTARSATVIIRRKYDEVQFIAKLEDGAMFPRQFQGASLGGIGTAEFGPVALGSPIRENTKFMNITQLKQLYHDPTRSRELSTRYMAVTRSEQEAAFAGTVAAALKTRGEYRFSADNEAYTLRIDPSVRVSSHANDNKVSLTCSAPTERQIRLQRSQSGEAVATDEARQMVLRVVADPENNYLRLRFQLEDVVVGSTEGQPRRQSFPRQFGVPMPPEIAALKDRGLQYYLTHGNVGGEDVKRIRKKLPGLRSGIVAEIHSRVSFAVSCLILVTVGCALGMMFKTGNYLSAFALSVIPALLCIALTVTGQHVCESNPSLMKLGLAVIWSGNILVFALVTSLLFHLRRQ
jgi:lipopolysaccharide export LptBFGC system permease protein LptF